jgi:hypothetical protein
MKINDIKEFFGNIRDVLNSPVINTVLIAGLFFILLSFFNRDSNGTIIVTSDPRWTMLWLGVSLFLVGVLLFIFRGEGIRLNKKLHIQDGFSIKFEETQVHLGIGTIQEVKGLDRTAAVVLPANTAFTDDCITDKNSALGAYVLDHFPAQIPEMTEAIA